MRRRRGAEKSDREKTENRETEKREKGNGAVLYRRKLSTKHFR